MKKLHISKEKIIITVSNSQKIEGYRSPSKNLQKKAKELMAKHNVKVSA